MVTSVLEYFAIEIRGMAADRVFHLRVDHRAMLFSRRVFRGVEGVADRSRGGVGDLAAGRHSIQPLPGRARSVARTTHTNRLPRDEPVCQAARSSPGAGLDHVGSLAAGCMRTARGD